MHIYETRSSELGKFSNTDNMNFLFLMVNMVLQTKKHVITYIFSEYIIRAYILSSIFCLFYISTTRAQSL